MTTKSKPILTDTEIFEELEKYLTGRGFGESSVKDVKAGAEKILKNSTLSRIEAIAFSPCGEKEYRPFLDEILPQLTFNQIGWYQVALGLMCHCLRGKANKLRYVKKDPIDSVFSENAKDSDEPVGFDTVESKGGERENSLPDEEIFNPEESNKNNSAFLPKPDKAQAELLLERYYGYSDIKRKTDCLQKTVSQVGFENSDGEAVRAKAEAVMKMYGKISLTPEQISSVIINQNLDESLKIGYEEAVVLLSKALGEGNSHGNYYFSVRFCAMHNPEKFPVADSSVIKAMRYYRDEYGFFNFSDDEPFDYDKYKKLLRIFRERFSLNGFSLTDISRMLTAAGRTLDR